MNTKLFTILCFLLIMAGTAMAQTKEQGVFIEMNVGHGTQKWFGGSGGYAILDPRLGYQFNRDWAAGIKAQFETGDNKEFYTYGIYAQYAFLHWGKVKAFTEATLSYSIDKMCIYGRSSENYTEAGFSIGALYALSNNLNIIARYLHIGYSGSPRNDRDAVLGGGDWVIDANHRRLSVGIQYIF